MARGQTTMDYAIGMSLFLLVLVGVFAFLPSIFAPFSADGGASLVVADRSADRLSGETLTNATATPTVLDADCTAAFFDASATVPTECNFETDASNLSGALGYDDRRHRLNVTIRGGSGIVTVSGTELQAGPVVPESGDVVTSSRVVLLDGDYDQLVVRVW
ncbi:MAG: hypothetical protein ABEJ68_10345 [Halobacteriaceae archaeon]